MNFQADEDGPDAAFFLDKRGESRPLHNSRSQEPVEEAGTGSGVAQNTSIRN